MTGYVVRSWYKSEIMREEGVLGGSEILDDAAARDTRKVCTAVQLTRY